MSMSNRSILYRRSSPQASFNVAHSPVTEHTFLSLILSSFSLFAGNGIFIGKSSGRSTLSRFIDSIAGHLHNAMVRLVTSEAVIDFEKDMTRNQVGAVFCNPDSGKVELRTQFFRHGIAEQVRCFDGKVLQDGA